jgi:hypothetical protein
MAMTLVSTVAVGSGGATTIDFTNIPQTGKDLLVVFSVRSDRSANESDVLTIRPNGSSANRSTLFLFGDGSTATTGSLTNGGIGSIPAATTTANVFSNHSVYISNYMSSSSKRFSVDASRENNASSVALNLISGTWADNSAITSLIFTNNNGNFLQNSTASLYIIS